MLKLHTIALISHASKVMLKILQARLQQFNLYTEFIMRNAGPEEAQAGLKIAWRNINNLRYADDLTVMAETEEELKSLLMKEESKEVGLKLNIQKTMMASGPITSWEIDGETVGTVSDHFWGLQNHCRWWLQPWS